MKKFDVVVIGSGPGGYVSAIRCAQLGMKTAIIEKRATLGGTCLNVGCIPSKALLDSSEHYHNATHTFDQHGIKTQNVTVDMPQMIKRKQEVVDQTCSGVAFLMNKNKIETVYGTATFKDNSTLSVALNAGGSEEIQADHFIIATGSKPNLPDAFNYDGKRVISSREALEITKVPKKMVIVGGGVIGLELGSVYARLGTEIHVVEYVDRILPGMDKDCSKELTRSLKKLGMKFYFKHAVVGTKTTSRSVTVQVEKRDSDEKFELKADYCLIAIGRVPYTEGLGLENTSVKLDDRGRIEVDDHFRTTAQNIYAIGDVVKGMMLAHKAEEEGVFVAEMLSGQKPHIDHNLIPGVVYTWPEVAAVGKTEQQLKDLGTPIKVGKFPYKALGRARASMDIEGMIKVISHAETDEILGVHMVGARVADMIMEAVALMEFRASAEDMARICHPHPTYTEAVKEAALAVHDRPIHI